MRTPKRHCKLACLKVRRSRTLGEGSFALPSYHDTRELDTKGATEVVGLSYYQLHSRPAVSNNRPEEHCARINQNPLWPRTAAVPPIYHNHPDLEQPQVPAVLGTPKRSALESVATLWTAVCILHFSANTFASEFLMFTLRGYLKCVRLA